MSSSQSEFKESLGNLEAPGQSTVHGKDGEYSLYCMHEVLLREPQDMGRTEPYKKATQKLAQRQAQRGLPQSEATLLSCWPLWPSLLEDQPAGGSGECGRRSCPDNQYVETR